MNEKIVKDNEIIEKMHEERKKGNNIFYIFLACLPVALYFSYKYDMWIQNIIILGIAFILFLYFYIVRNKDFNQKIKEVEEHSAEINEHCVSLGGDLYITKNSIMYMTGSSSKNRFIKRDEILNYTTERPDEGPPEIIIKTKDYKIFRHSYSEPLADFINNYYKEHKVIKNDLVKYLEIYNHYAEGKIEVPAFNQECDIYIMNPEGALEYAESTARKAREFVFSDFKDAITCSLWSYRDFLKNGGYIKSLYEDNKIPYDVTEKNILDYMSLGAISSCDSGITFLFSAPWEPEHDISWVYKGKELIYVGSGNDIDADIGESVLKGEWNYAKKYHKEVTLTEEEWERVKQTYKEVVENSTNNR